MPLTHHPRSILHALPPQGLDTPDVESLTSYVCRLAHSHASSSQQLVDWILAHQHQSVCARYRWHQRNLSGMSAESEQWAAWLAELTSIESLDRLTLAPWRPLLGTPGLAPKADRWCPCCLAEDRQQQRPTYLRLAWDLAPVTVCARHQVTLTATCPHCQQQGIRHRATIVVPGYCTACGGFLGDAPEAMEPADEPARWIACQVGQLLAQRPQIGTEAIRPLLEHAIATLAHGQMAAFAKLHGFSKGGVSHWLHQGGCPSLPAWLTMAQQGGIELAQLFAGNVVDWQLPLVAQPQLPIPLLVSPRAGIRSRELHWEVIRRRLKGLLQLPVPISMNEAGRRLGVDSRHLYLRANAEARAIADRYRRYRSEIKRQRELVGQANIKALLAERLQAGYDGMSARDVLARLEKPDRAVPDLFRYIGRVIDGDAD